ncbi:folylpolyglutamate synthase, mitochondrial isoform X2 [Folsomia candida]|nr:folylpolyglutamate synthase, mitochondrial isoform X2 [Folsomia candida]
MTMFLETIGISKTDLESLNTIHVTGTKGKGMTCAFTESMLRKAGLRTGFYSSPHLVVVRERIRINGTPISPEKFAKYFFPVYNSLHAWQMKYPEFQMPPYFRFITCMAFYAFLKEKVDVAIFEVGIGGRYDCTNVIPNPTVVGITSLGLEHQSMLGNTLEEIAWNKVGIMKANCPAFTVDNHPSDILKLMQDYAIQVNCPFAVVPKMCELSKKVQLGVDDGNVSELNSALAVQLTTSFLKQKFPEKLHLCESEKEIPFFQCSKLLSPAHISGLESTRWLGRFQRIPKSNFLQYYLDGAHTPASLCIALEWFTNVSSKSSCHVLIFNVTGERASDLVIPFAQSNIFQLAIFCPVVRRGTTPDRDNWNVLNVSRETDLISVCKKHAEEWNSVNSCASLILDSTDAAIDFVNGLSNQTTKAHHLELFTSNKQNVSETVEVLVTGSLHLVGNVLSILVPSMNDE